LLQVSDGIPSLIKVLSKSMDSSLTSDKVELATITRDEATGKVSDWHKQRCDAIDCSLRHSSSGAGHHHTR
jgi:hypothetical protein